MGNDSFGNSVIFNGVCGMRERFFSLVAKLCDFFLFKKFSHMKLLLKCKLIADCYPMYRFLIVPDFELFELLYLVDMYDLLVTVYLIWFVDLDNTYVKFQCHDWRSIMVAEMLCEFPCFPMVNKLSCAVAICAKQMLCLNLRA